MKTDKLSRLNDIVQREYAQSPIDLPFHGWSHVYFVRHHAVKFADELGANKEVVEAAALVHDLNYLVDVRSRAAAGRELASKLLSESNYGQDEIATITGIVLQAETASRGRETCPEVMALSDGDTLFKILPITPVVLSPLFLEESGRTVWEQARRIVDEQAPLFRDGLYFYSASANEKYLGWAKTNLELWQNILEVADDPVINQLYEDVRPRPM